MPSSLNNHASLQQSETNSRALSVSVPIVGIGASAGGLEAFTELLRDLDIKTGMAFIFIQHLDPNHKSHLQEVLSRATTMPVMEIIHNTEVEANHVYVIPPNTRLTVEGGRLKLEMRGTDEDSHYPIDHFFKSLAHGFSDRAIAVVLSGSGTDGAQGIESIAAEGGITFAQDETTAQFPYMPRAAIVSGVDHILSPSDIAKELANMVCNILDFKSGMSENLSDFQSILKLLSIARSMDFTQYKMPTVQRRILRRMSIRQIESFEEYCSLLKLDSVEVDNLYEDILIKVTEFFRVPESFKTLKNIIFPKIIINSNTAPSIRIWVPGCSTGEEAYSIAICLLETLDRLGTMAKIEIFATDISETALALARIGVYDEARLQNVSAERLKRFFVKEDRGYRVSSSLREKCIFAKQNVTRDPPFSRLDMISCRNLLIYLTPVLQEKVFASFHFALKSQGFLVLGSAETLGNCSDLFDVVDKPSKIYLRNDAMRTLRAPAFESELPLEKVAQVRGHAAPRAETLLKPDIRSDADRSILAKFAPPGVVVNDRMDVVYFRGDTSAYLFHPPGEITASLFRMCRDGLLAEVRTAMHEASSKDEPVVRRAWLRNGSHEALPVTLHVIPFAASGSNQRHYTLLFSPSPAEEGTSKLSPEDSSENQRLTRELFETKEYLNAIIDREQAANEELQSASEEIQSSNEELQSTNEEMATAKEEVQATNEELITVNEELSDRFQELNRVNNDLNNLFSAANIPIVMISEDLCIRSFTQAAEKALNLTSKDLGRSLKELSGSLQIDGLESITSRVIATLNTNEQEIQDREGRWYSLRIKPYRTSDNRIDGAVIALVDIDLLKSSLDRITEANEYSEAIIETAPVPLLILDGELKVVTATEAFCRLFQVTLQETRNVKIYELGRGAWNTPKLRRLLEEILPQNERIENLLVDEDFPGLGRRIMRLNARRLVQQSGRAARILLAIDDVTLEKETEERTAFAKNAAESANAAKSDFLANMSHEIRTPLSAILGYSELLANPEQTKADALNCTQRIQTNIAHLTQLVDEILDISKIEAGKLEVERVAFPLLPELAEAFTLLTDRAKAKNLRLTFTFENDIPENIFACPLRFRQILLNVIGNAIKFTEIGQVAVHITLDSSTRSASGFLLTFVVVDSGCGLSSEQQSRLFQPFSQADSSVTRKYGGTGLGLVLARRLAEALGGDVVLTKSFLGEGSTFTFTLDPGSLRNVSLISGLKSDALIKSSLRAPAIDIFQPNKLLVGIRVLLAEDSPDIQLIMTRFLEESGATVAVASNGAEAVQQAMLNEFDLILMDMQMPGVDGYEATRQLKEQGNTIPVVALTANAMRGERETCLAMGCVEYISKPVRVNQLIEVVAHFSKKKDLTATCEHQTISDFHDHPLVGPIVKVFIGNLPMRLSALREAQRRNDRKAISALSHQLAGSSGSYGYPEMSRIASTIEEHIRNEVHGDTLASTIKRLGELCGAAMEGMEPRQ